MEYHWKTSSYLPFTGSDLDLKVRLGPPFLNLTDTGHIISASAPEKHTEYIR
jgi:hypothetical protein